MACDSRNEGSAPEHITGNAWLINTNDGFRLSDGPELPQIPRNSFTKSFSDEITGALAGGASDSDRRYDSSRNVQIYAQNKDEDTSAPEEPFSNQKPRPEAKVMPGDSAAKPSSIRSAHGGVPQPLRPYSSMKLLGLVVELFICLLPSACLTLAILAKCLEGREISRYGENIKKWTALSPTIFPLVFAAVVGQSLRNIARYRLEQGCILKHVEQLIGSQSVFGTIATQVRLQLIDVAGIMLILLWLISPLGSQASLRLLTTQESSVTATSQIGFANLTNSSSQLFDDLQSRLYETVMNGVYIANLVSPLSVKQGPQDPWGNIKIPTYESLSTQSDRSGFKPVSNDDQTDWVSLLGLPITGLKQGKRVTSTISTQYYYINCSLLYGVDGTTNWPARLGLSDNYNNTNIWLSNTTSLDFPSQWLVFFTGKNNEEGFPDSPTMKMVFASWSGESIGSDAGVYYTSNATIADCTIEPSFIDLQVACEGFSCRAVGARRSSKKRPSSTSYPEYAYWWGGLLDWPSEFQRDFIVYWTHADTAPDTGQISPTLNYIGGSEAFPFAASSPGGVHPGYQAGGAAPNLYELGLEDVTRRIRRLFNTYWQASIGPGAYNATIPQGDPAAFLSGKTAYESNSRYLMSIDPSGATFEHDVTIYKCDPWWFTITIVASSILLITGFVGFAAKCACVGPDLLNSFTTTLRANPHTARLLSDDNSTLDSGEVAKANKNLFIALKDVKPDQDIGLVAIGVGTNNRSFRQKIADIRRRNKGRLYE